MVTHVCWHSLHRAANSASYVAWYLCKASVKLTLNSRARSQMLRLLFANILHLLLAALWRITNSWSQCSSALSQTLEKVYVCRNAACSSSHFNVVHKNWTKLPCVADICLRSLFPAWHLMSRIQARNRIKSGQAPRVVHRHLTNITIQVF